MSVTAKEWHRLHREAFANKRVWPMQIDVKGYSPPKLTRLMRLTLGLLRITHAHRYPDKDGAFWNVITEPKAKDWKRPRISTLDALSRRGLAQWICLEPDKGGFWRISANGKAFTIK